MLQITPQMRVLVAIEPTDFRRGIDGLARQCTVVLEADPFSGTVFLFTNKSRTAIKALVYDGQGFWLCQKRLSSGRFRHWPSPADRGSSRVLLAHEVAVLLNGGDFEQVQAAAEWRTVRPA